MKVLKKVLVMFLIILLINILPLCLQISNVSAADTVELSLVTSPYIDVVLSKSKTRTNLTNFKPDLLTALKEQGVDTTKVNITAIEAQQVNMQSAFRWQQDVNTSIGRITIENNGQSVRMVGNRTKLGKNAIWIIPDKELEQTFTFDYNINYGDSFNAAGMLLRVNQSGNTLTGYMLSFNKSGKDWYSTSGANGAIWEFSYTIGQNTTNMTKYLKQALTINTSGTLTVKASPTEITVSGGGLSSPVTYQAEKTFGNGFGFFADHYSHNCEKIGSFTLQNINLETEEVKKIEEVLREHDWREEAIKVLVNVNDVVNEQLDNPTSLGELLTRMINDEIHYVAWGKDVNKTQSDNFIAANNNNGIFIDNTSYTNSITQTAIYIKSLIETQQSEQYVILNENTVVSSLDDSIMTNTAYGDYPYGRWKILHDCEYFENNIGQFAQAGKYISDMITSFNKTGKYEILYEDRNILPTYIYVHRKPVAEIDVQRDGDSVTLTSLGYDLDKYSDNKGIEEEEWKHRKVGETIWHDGKLTDISGGTDYLVQLRVKDFQGTWSAPITKYITKNDVPPIASFKIKNKNTSIYEKIEIVDGSYDPYGGTITSRSWVVYKGSTQIYNGTTPLTEYQSYGTGSYTMTLEVTNNRGLTSELFKRNFTIIPDDEAPEFTAIPMDCDWQTSVTVNLKFTDRLGSGFKSYQYAITTSQEEPTSWSSAIEKIEDNILIDIDGIQYLHIKATDNAGNVSEDRVVGPYKIDRTKPVANISHTPTEWVIDIVTINWQFTDSQSGMKQVKLSDGTITTDSQGEYQVTENGDYTFEATDNVGNVETVVKTIDNIDKISPEGVLSLDYDYLTDEEIYINWIAMDGQSGFDSIALPDATVSKEAEGKFKVEQMGTYTFIIYDKVGNDKTISIEVNNVDMESPILKVTQKSTRWTNEDVTLYWEAYDNQSGLKEVVLPNSEKKVDNQGTHVVTQNGIYTFLAYDKIGNGTLVSHEVTNIDKIAPVLELRKEIDKNGNVKIAWNMEDHESGIQYITLPNGTFSTNKEGTFEVNNNGIYAFIAYDKVGNDRIVKIEVNDIDKKGIVFNLWLEQGQEEEYQIYWSVIEGDDFKQIVLPDNTYSEKLQDCFYTKEKGTYTFLAYDKFGNETRGSITIE